MRGVVSEVRRPIKAGNVTLSSMRLRDDTGIVRVVFHGPRASSVLHFGVGQTVELHNPDIRILGPSLAELSIDNAYQIVREARDPLPINLRKPFHAVQPSPIARLVAGELAVQQAVTLLAKVVAVDPTGPPGACTLTLSDHTGVTTLPLGADDAATVAASHGDMVLFENLVVVRHGATGLAVRFNQHSSFIAQPDTPEADFLANWFRCNPDGPHARQQAAAAATAAVTADTAFLVDVSHHLQTPNYKASVNAVVTKVTLQTKRGESGVSGARASLTDHTGTLHHVALGAAAASALCSLVAADTSAIGLAADPRDAEERLLWARVSVALSIRQGVLTVMGVRPVDFRADAHQSAQALRFK